ncbi:hypothetical protein ACSMXN_03325 [Jatrophihabitans sp. DSM 45814]
MSRRKPRQGELLEETGYRADDITHLVTFEPMIGTVSSPHHVFLARGATQIAAPTEQDEGTFEWVRAAELRNIIATGQVHNSGTLVGLLHFLAFDETAR